MVYKFKLSLLAFFILPLSTVFALEKNLDEYFNRFIYLKNDQGQVVKILDSKLSFNPGVKVFVQKTKRMYQDFFDNFSKESEEFSELSHIINQAADIEDLDLTYKEFYKKIIKVIEDKSLLEKMDDPLVQLSLTNFEKKLNLVNQEDFQTIAHLQKNNFFYESNLFKHTLRYTVKFIKKFITVPILADLTMDLVLEYIDALKEMKRYSQSMLLYYLTNYSASDLRLTEKELKYSLSSLMEADIKWYNFKAHIKATKNWKGFGDVYFQKMKEKSKSRFDKYKKNLKGELSFMGPLFVRTSISSVDRNFKIFNIFTGSSYFSKKPTLVYDINKPDLNFQKRLLFKLTSFASGFTGIPGFSFILGKYLESRFENQTRKEGYLAAWYLNRGDISMYRNLIKQTANPLMYLGF